MNSKEPEFKTIGRKDITTSPNCSRNMLSRCVDTPKQEKSVAIQIQNMEKELKEARWSFEG